MGKLYVAEAATNMTRRCAQLAGYDGYSRDFPLERLMRDAKITEIYLTRLKYGTPVFLVSSPGIVFTRTQIFEAI